jgi:hypothetical protein
VAPADDAAVPPSAEPQQEAAPVARDAAPEGQAQPRVANPAPAAAAANGAKPKPVLSNPLFEAMQPRKG